MKKISFIATIGLALLGLGIITTSCSTDGFDEKYVGELDDERAVYDLPNGYRIRSVGDIRYYYKTNGKLDYVHVNGKDYDLTDNTIIYDENGNRTKYTLTFNVYNLITKVKYTTTIKDEDFTENGEGTIKVSYNSNRQIDKLTTKYASEGVDENEKYQYEWESTMDYSYDLARLRRVKWQYEETERYNNKKETDYFTSVIGFDYDDDIEDFFNRYYQWTPNLVKYVMGSDIDNMSAALTYVGMFGRATSYLPEKITQEVTGKSSSEGDYNHDDTYRCRYEFNTYNAIRSADGLSYSYTDKDLDYGVKPYVDFETRSAMPAAAHRSSLFQYRGRRK